MNKKTWLTLLALVLCAVVSVLGALLTCPKCGYEQTEGTEKCTHCGADLPKPPPKVTTDPAKFVKPTWAIAADEEARKSSEAAKARKLWLAWFYARNAYTLNMMTDGTNSTRAAKLVSVQEGYEKQLRTSAVNCPLCKGTGHPDVRFKLSSGQERVMRSESSHCKFCDSVGTLGIFVRADQLNHDRAQVKRDYDALQKDRGWTGLNGLWLPGELTKDLTLKERVQLMHTLGSVCLDCAGLGRLACVKCDGAGWAKCSNMECEAGYAPCPDCGATGKPTKKTTSSSGKYSSLGSFCQTCSGTGRMLCRTCKGAAHLGCQGCGGRAIQVCKTCSGNGQNPICSQCKGDGTMTCNHCRGAGKMRNILCADCNGDGQTLCPICKGVGRAARR